MKSLCACSFVLILLFGPFVHVARGEIEAEQVGQAIERAIAFLKREQQRNGNWVELDRGNYNGGVTALCTLALLEAGLPPDHAAVRRGLEFLRSVKSKKTYVVALQTMVFCRAGQVADRAQIRENVRWLEQVQSRDGADRGGWGYGNGPGVDNSNAQFAMLALFEAEQAGFDVKEHTWQAALGYWRRGQNPGGSWGYHHQTPGRGSMTCAGIASLVIAQESQREGGVHLENGRCDCGQAEPDEHIDKGIRWLGRNFSVTHNPDENSVAPKAGRQGRWHFYYLYGLERVGRVTARRFFYKPANPLDKNAKRFDWYREGADYLLNGRNRQNADGSWAGDIEPYPHIGTAMALLFLSKGRRPVLISKLQRTGNDWSRVPNELTNLTRYIERKWKMPMTWQVIDGNQSTADDFSQTPVLFLSGSEPFTFSAAQRTELRRYVEQGGFIFADGCCTDNGFDQSFRQEMREIFPDEGHELKRLDAQHPIWRIDERINQNYVDQDGRWLWGIDLACKTSVIYCPGNLSCYWALDSPRRNADHPQAVRDEIATCRAIGVNVLAYATGRKLKPKDAIPTELPKTKSEETGERGHLAIAKLRHSGGCDAAPRAMANLMDSITHTLDIRTSNRAPLLPLTDEALFNYHFVYMQGRYDFRLSPQEKSQLKMFVERGGIVMGDAICGSVAFAKAFRREMRDVFETPLVRIAPDHPILTEEYGGADLSNVMRREAVRRGDGGLEIKHRRGPPTLEGIIINKRYGVIFSPMDLSCALEKHVTPHCRGYTPKDAARIATNVILYSLHE